MPKPSHLRSGSPAQQISLSPRFSFTESTSGLIA